MVRKESNAAALVIVCLCGWSVGVPLGIMSGVLGESPWVNENSGMKGFMSSCVEFGVLIGSTLSGFLVDKFGALKIMFCGGMIAILCAIGLAFQKHVVLFILFRTLTGFGIGFLDTIGPLYSGDLSSAKARGTVVGMFQTMFCFGIVWAYVLNLIFSFVKDGWGWRFEFALAIVPCVLICVAVFFVPESNNFREKKEREREKKEKREENAHEVGDLGESESAMGAFFKSIGKNKKIYTVGFVLSFFAQITGNLVVVMYSPSILNSAGFSGAALLTAIVFIGVWNVLCTAIPFFTTDRLGRVVLLVAGFLIMFVGAVILAVAQAVTMEKPYVLSIVGIAIHLFGYNVGPGPVYYVVISEMFPVAVRSMAISACFCVLLLGAIFIVFAYLPLAEAVGELPVFVAVAVFCLFSAVFVWLLLPETKGRSLDEQDEQSDSGSGDGTGEGEGKGKKRGGGSVSPNISETAEKGEGKEEVEKKGNIQLEVEEPWLEAV